MKLWSTTREKKLITIIGCLVLISASFWFSSSKKGSEEAVFLSQLETLASPEKMETEEKSTTEGVEKEEQAINEAVILIVDVKGAVRQPNVYKMKEDARVIDAIQQAGGLEEEAVTDSINLAQKIVDGMVIYVPTEEEMNSDESLSVKEFANSTHPTQQGNSNNNSDKININIATASELEQLPGIGPSKAQAIITNREEKGKFTSIEELLNITGIGPKGFEKIKELVEY